jgi:hypothetical protein
MNRTLIEELKDPDLSEYADPAKANAYLLGLCHDAHLALKESQAQPVAVVKVLPMGEGNPPFHYIECQHIPEGTKLFREEPPRQPLTDEQEREAFEAWCYSVGLMQKSYGILSINSQTETAWLAWKARAAHGIKGKA